MTRGSRMLTGLLLLACTAFGAGGDGADLESPDPAVRREAARRLAGTPDPGAFAELIRAVRRESDGEARRLMLIALGRSGDPLALWDLYRRIDDPDRAALWAIRTILEDAPPGPPEEAAILEMPGPEWNGWRYRKDVGKYVRPPPAPGEEAGLLGELRSPDERVALRAAERLDPYRLTLEELRTQASLLARAPCSFAFEARGNPLGTVDFPTVWAGLASSGVAPGECRDHWPMLPDAIPALVSLLPAAN
ncbi:MAG: HEAT repeat domain-containing protein, partial [Planctomycetes bacterium]|nr:HEAT repeat domain-containing protein [Planctomycetota bacterium]